MTLLDAAFVAWHLRASRDVDVAAGATPTRAEECHGDVPPVIEPSYATQPRLDPRST